MLGEILDNRYRVLRIMSSNDIVTVYLAEDLDDGYLVTVKLFHPHLALDADYLQRCIEHANQSLLLDSHHVEKILTCYFGEDVQYLVTEYIEGQTIQELLDKRGMVPWREALSLVDQLCHALEDAHQHHVIHYNLNPNTIILSNERSLKVCDFGFIPIHILPSATTSDIITWADNLSPESLMGDECDIRSNIYTVGILFYQMLCGHVPFSDENYWSVVSQHISSEPPKISHSDIPHSCRALLEWTLAKRPSDRFQTPSEVRYGINTILTGQPLPGPEQAITLDRVKRIELADRYYQQAEQTISSETWQQAVSLLHKTLSLSPNHPQARSKLAFSGVMARLAVLYDMAMTAFEMGYWQETIDYITEIAEVEPDYKDCQNLLATAQDMNDGEHIEMQVSDLYKQALDCVEDEAYSQAKDILNQIRHVSPKYPPARKLLTRIKKHQQREEVRKSLNVMELWQYLMSFRVYIAPYYKPIVIAVTVMLVIIGTVFTISQVTEQIAASSPSVDELYHQAEFAFTEENARQARKLLQQVFDDAPNHPQAQLLMSQVDQYDALNNTLTEAHSALAGQDWSRAIDILGKIRGSDDNFKPEMISLLLCNAHLARGKSQIDTMFNPYNRRKVESALDDFQTTLLAENNQARCSNPNELIQQIQFAIGYLHAIDDIVVLDTRIDNLSLIVEIEPDYANGQAAQVLYQAYLKRGDIKMERHDFSAAFDDYNAALLLPVEDLRQAQKHQAETIQYLTLTPVPTLVPTLTSIPIAKIISLPSVDQSSSRVQLISPEPHATYLSSAANITFVWEGASPLAIDEYYVITMRYSVDTHTRHWQSELLKETMWHVLYTADYGRADNGEFFWGVTIQKKDGTIIFSSEERTLIWKL
ncbi:MAG: hypothetical protein B6242_02735 [Anaerolineaceae bacterium 4572_78]|nr:MAG: hypothetical protein B6242_02735 [Anaerolineaceae bacterium 4572_78]